MAVAEGAADEHDQRHDEDPLRPEVAVAAGKDPDQDGNQIHERVLEREHVWQQSIRSSQISERGIGVLRARHSGEASGFPGVLPVVGERWLQRLHLEDG